MGKKINEHIFTDIASEGVKLQHRLLLVLLCSDYVQASRRDCFLAVKRGEMWVIQQWLMGYTGAAATRGQEVRSARWEEETQRKASAAGRHKGNVPTAARALLVEEKGIIDGGNLCQG